MQSFKHCKISVTGLLQALAIGKNINFLWFKDCGRGVGIPRVKGEWS